MPIRSGTSQPPWSIRSKDDDAYRRYKEHLTKALLLGLEFLVAADIVRTVAIDTTLANVAILGALVVVRSVLSWSLVVEMEGRWPWQVGAGGVVRGGVEMSDALALVAFLLACAPYLVLRGLANRITRAAHGML